MKYPMLSILSIHESTDLFAEGTQDMYVQGDTGAVCSRGHRTCLFKGI